MDWTRGHTIGHGSSATVSLATARPSGDVFAVKSIELERSELLQREQRILSSLGCPQIVGYIGSDVTNEDGKLMYNIFMEYVPGGTLTDAIQKEGGRLDESAIRSHTRSILKGLEYLHSKGLVHCDIKGRNVLVGQEGAKIADLGCARWVEELGGKASRVPIAGTPVFMSPEVARGDEQGFPADVWALGCTVIEMATGRPPWLDFTHPASALYRIAFSSDVPEFSNFLSEEGKDFLGKCLRREPEERWTTDQLLKHPFLDEASSQLKQILDSTSNSPTSILDQGFWDPLDESETPHNLTHIGSSDSPAERIRRLSGGNPISAPILPDWTWDENWVTVRSNDYQENEIFSCRDHSMIPAGEATTTGGSASIWVSDEEGVEFYESSVFIEDSLNYSVFCIGSSHWRGSVICKCINVIAESCSLNNERNNKNFCFLSISIFLEARPISSFGLKLSWLKFLWAQQRQPADDWFFSSVVNGS